MPLNSKDAISLTVTPPESDRYEYKNTLVLERFLKDNTVEIECNRLGTKGNLQIF